MQRKCNERKYVAFFMFLWYTNSEVKSMSINKENKFLEFKRERTKSYLKTVSAFANYYDGEIRFGVDDSGAIVPISDQMAFSLDIETQINDSIKPRPNYSIVANSNGTISLFVKKGLDTPYFCNNKAYTRKDTATVEVDVVELKRLIMEGTNRTFDELDYADSDLSFKELEKALKETIKLSVFNNDVLKTLELVNTNGFNNAAALLSDDNHFPGVEIRVFKDDNTIKEEINLSGLSLIKQFNESITIFKRNYIVEEINGDKRTVKELIPLIAFREIIANAIVHRTYDIPANTKVAMYKDHIYISSPGGLMFGLSKEQYLRGAFSQLRNPIIANVFKRIGIIEAFATGIKRTFSCYAKTGRNPDFDIDDYSISVSLPVINEIKPQDLKGNELLSKMSPSIKYTRSELEALSGYNKDKVIRVLNKLLDQGLVKKEGSGKSTLYFVA